MIVSVDASGLEWRVLVELSRDEIALAEILEGQDTHELNRVAFDLPERRVAKFYLFRTIYRGTGWAFAHDPYFMHVSTDPRYWDGIGEKFYSKYKGIDLIHKKWANEVMAGRTLRGPSGREWVIPVRRDERSGELKVPWTTLTNYPVQGTGADVMMLARVSFFRRLKASGIPALLVSTVHDSIVVDTPSMYVELVAKLFYEVFDDLIANIKRCFGYEWIVPLDCEVKFGMDMENTQKITKDLQVVAN